MYEDRVFDTIMEEMMAAFGRDVRTDEGSLAYNACAKIAEKLEEIYGDMDELNDNILPDTQDDWHLIEYGKELKKSEEEIYRALCVSNLVALNQKRYIGSLSAYCGAVCAAAGAGAGITYLCGGNLEQIQNTVVNTIADAGGIVCDGAKPSCAAKIATSLQAAILSHKMAMRGLVFGSGEGLVMDCPEDTIKAVGYVGRAGMKQTDVEILNLMIGKTKIEDIEK